MLTGIRRRGRIGESARERAARRGSRRRTDRLRPLSHAGPLGADGRAPLVVELKLSNRVVDMVEEGIDLAVRIAPALEGQFVARPIARVTLAVYGSESYFRRYGRPRKPEELAAHRNVVFVEPKPYDELTFSRGTRKVRVKLKTALASNLGSAQLEAAVSGLGLALLPSFLAEADRAPAASSRSCSTGRCRRSGCSRCIRTGGFSRRTLGAFVEALRAAFGDGTRDPWWPAAARGEQRARPRS